MVKKPLISQETPAQARAATPEFSGYRADTDDVLKELELTEEDINPTVRAQKRSSAAGGPVGMMPPMMGGVGKPVGVAGAGGSGRVGAGSAGGGLGSTGSVLGSAGNGGLASGVGIGSSGGAGLGADGGTVAASSVGTGYGFGINPATGRPWSPSDPGFVERFGTYDPLTGRYMNSVTGHVYDPATGTWTTPTPGTGTSPGVTHGTDETSGMPGQHAPAIPGGTSPGVGTGDGTPSAGPGTGMDFGAGVGPVAGGNLGQEGQLSSFGGRPGIEVDPVDIDRSRKRWDDIGERMRAVQSLIYGLEKVTFEKVSQPLAAYSGAELAAVDTAGTSTTQMTSTSTNLGASAAGYNQTEQENAGIGEKMVEK